MFVRVFPTPKPEPSVWLSRLLIGLGGVLLLLSPTALIASRTNANNGVLRVSYGVLHPLFAVYFVGTLAYSLALLARKQKVLKGAEKLQAGYVLLAVTSAGFGATATNLLAPLLLKTSRFSPYGPVFSILLIALIAHSIIRYRLMNISLVIRRGATYVLATAVAAAAFLFLAWTIAGIVSTRHTELPLWLGLSSALLVALLFNPLKLTIQNWLDLYFFREPYDYQRRIREVTRTMATVLHLPALLDYSCDAIAKTMHAESVTLYILNPSRAEFVPAVRRMSANLASKPEPQPIPAHSPLAEFMSKTSAHVVGNELRRHERSPDGLAAAKELQDLSAELALPIVRDQTVRGFILLGPKLSGDAYFSEDLDFLTTLVSQAAIAMKNAQLYSEVLLANEYIENILTTMESGVIAVAADGKVTLFNSAADQLTNNRGNQVKGLDLICLPETIAAALRATLSDGQARSQLEMSIERRAGDVTPIICSTSPLLSGDAGVLGAVAVFSDLSRVKRLEDEKRQAERLASIGALAAGIAHEIKNPLVAIKTFAELLPERFSEEDFRSDFLNVVIREIDRIDDLVARLRGLATTPANASMPLDLRGPIQETLALLRGQLEQRQIAVDFTCEANSPFVVGDWAQLKQLFLNLFVNSIEAMSANGQLSIRIHAVESARGRAIIAEVSDTGIGIPDLILNRIFDPFFTTKERGSGLGLSICRGIADAHRALIRAENKQDHSGTTVTVEFLAFGGSPVVVSTSADMPA